MLIQIIFPLAKMLLSTRGARSQDIMSFKLNLRLIFFPYQDDLVVSVIYGAASSKTQATVSGMHQWLLILSCVKLSDLYLCLLCCEFVQKQRVFPVLPPWPELQPGAFAKFLPTHPPLAH